MTAWQFFEIFLDGPATHDLKHNLFVHTDTNYETTQPCLLP